MNLVVGAIPLLFLAVAVRAISHGTEEDDDDDNMHSSSSGKGSKGMMSSSSSRPHDSKMIHKKMKGTDEKSKCTELDLVDTCPYGNVIDDQCWTVQMIADRTVQALFVDFDPVVASTLLATDYIQHNPTVPTGAAPILAILPTLRDSGLSIEVHRTIVEGNLVAYHSTYSNAELFGAPTLIGFDVFRVEQGQVQEHWDNLQVKQGPNPNGNTMVDGATMIKYRDQTAANKAHVVGLIDNVFRGRDMPAQLSDYISNVTYTQHNPAIADGLDGLEAGFAALAEQGLTGEYYPNNKLVVAEGNFVLVGNEGEWGGNLTAFYDLFRLQNGLIVEHWDVLQAIPPATEFAHENGKF